VRRVRRWAFTVVAVDFAALAVLGIWLAFRYQPGDSSAAGLHAVLGIVAVLAALVAAIATVADDERPTSAVLPAIVVLGVIAGLYLTGPSLKWDLINGSTTERGITPAFHRGVTSVGVSGKQMTAPQYQRIAWLHAAALPVVVVAMSGAGMWAVRRRRSYVAQRAVDEQVVDLR
jgi:uncharacterized membrane protein